MIQALVLFLAAAIPVLVYAWRHRHDVPEDIPEPEPPPRPLDRFHRWDNREDQP